MNERIKLLAEQAAKDNSDGYPVTMEYNNKFAENLSKLIVQECGVALSPMLRDMVSRGQAYDLIKQHFGVEE